MPNTTFVGFNFPSSSTRSYTDSQVVREIQPITTWNRDGGYTVTRRWRGPIDSLVAFSGGGSGEADYHGTYFTGTVGILLGGAGRDGAVSTNLERDTGGFLGTFSATWVTSNIDAVLGDPAAAGRTGTSGDQYQESSQWTLDGNDLEKSIYQCDIITICAQVLDDNTPDSGNGLGARIRRAVDLYVSGRDKANTPLSDPFAKAFQLADYLDGIMTILAGEDSVTKPSPATLQGDLEDLCVDILNGQDSFTISQYVLRNTKTVPYTSSIIPAYAKVQRVWDTSDITTLMAAETRAIDPPTSVVNFTLPLLGVLGSAIFSASKWLYRTPDVQQMNNGKWQITKEWWEGSQISVFTYQAYDAP